MRSYRKPGVYFEWAPPQTQGAAIGPRMDVAGFVGIAARGEIGKPVRLESWSEFVATFGDAIPQGHLGPAVAGFFANGGRACWVVRAADPVLAKPASATILDPAGKPLIQVVARTPGFWAHDLVVTLTPRGARTFDLTLVLPGEEYETWRNLTLPAWKNDDAANRADFVIRDNSLLVRLELLYPLPDTPPLAAAATATATARMRLIPSTFLNTVETVRDDQSAIGIDRRRTTILQGGGDGLAAEAVLADPDGVPAVRLLRIDQDNPGRFLGVRVETADPARRRFTLVVAIETGDGWSERERFELSVAPGDPDWFPRRLNDPTAGSRLVAAVTPADDGGNGAVLRTPAPTPSLIRLEGGLDLVHLLGSDPDQPYDPDLAGEPEGGLERLGWVPEVGMVAIPDLMPCVAARPARVRRRCAVPQPAPMTGAVDADDLRPFPLPFTAGRIAAAQQRILLHCQLKADRVAILDSPSGADPLTSDGLTATASVLAERGVFGSSWGALYFPWLLVQGLRSGGPAIRLPPSGHVAGIYARVEQELGVASAPANQLLDGVADVAVKVDDVTAGDLNVSGINVISADRLGVRINGARTLWRADAAIFDDDSPDAPAPHDKPWRYVSVRRLVAMIGRAVVEAGHWMVFEPNDRRLWRDLERVVRGLLDRLWRTGMLDGELPEDAYFVRCDEATNPPDQLAAGMVVCLIGLQPPLPAEFVIIRIGRAENSARMLE